MKSEMMHIFFEFSFSHKTIECFVNPTMTLASCMNLLSIDYPYYDSHTVLFIEKMDGEMLDKTINLIQLGLKDGIRIEVF